MKLFYLAVLLFAFIPLSHAQRIGPVFWQSNGGSCTPTAATIQHSEHYTVTAAGSIKHKGDSTEPIMFSCPISNINSRTSLADAVVLALYAKDPDGKGTDFKVEATLKTFAKEDNQLSVSSICRVISDSTDSMHRNNSGPCKDMDLSTHIYWVEVVLSRTAPGDKTAEFSGIALTGFMH